MAVPNLSTEERAQALAKAQEMRTKRMELRKELKSGKVSLTEVLKRDDEVVSRMKVKYLLESLPNVGKITAVSIMEEIGINESRRVQGLGKRQKAMLLEKLA
ncbi:MAG TPA: integration host factor, actinobacterial type [Clostridiales bacterium]|nr:integration host factor, actinobacterial type [Clostridiales bacterium]